MSPAENRTLNQAIEDLNNVNSRGHGKSGKYRRMEDALTTLTSVIAKYYPQNGNEAPNLSDENLKEIRDAYSTAIRRCNEYTSGKGDTRSSDYGQGRLNCVKEITRILNQDMLAISEIKGREQKTLPEVISRGRISETQITEEDLSIAKGGMTNRIPLAVQTADGVCEGFFTADKKQPSLSEIMQELGEKFNFDEGPIAELVKGSLEDEDSRRHLLDNLLGKFDEFSGWTEMLKSNIRNNPVSFMNHLEDLIDAHVTDIDDNKRVKEALNKSQELRNAFYDFVMAGGSAYSTQWVNRTKGGIQPGQDIPKRNVAVSRVANLLGMGSLVARAERMTLTDNAGNTITGVFQEKAAGSDAHRLKENDPLRKLTDNREMLNEPEFLRQLSDIQVMDYIVGNPDRHEGNLMYQMEEVDGKMKLVGIKAIDNDMSMGIFHKGDFKGSGRYITMPENLMIIRKETADAIKAMAENDNQLKFALQDMNFTEDEMSAAIDRIKDIDQAIRDNKITVAKDEEFSSYKFADLKSKGKQTDPGAPRKNLFDIVDNMAVGVKNWPTAQGEEQVKYNAARSIERQYRREGAIRVNDLAAQLNTLEEIQGSFVSTDILVHRDSGPFKLMKTTLNDCIGTIRQMQEKYKGSAELSEEDAKKLESAYRQLRNASSGYYAGHTNATSDMGTARKNGAYTMKDLWPPRLEAPVNTLNLQQMMDKNGIIQVPERKESLRNGSRNQSIPENMIEDEDDDSFVIEGYEVKRNKNNSKSSGLSFS